MEWGENRGGQREVLGHLEAHDRDRVLTKGMGAGYLGERPELYKEVRFRCMYVSAYC